MIMWQSLEPSSTIYNAHILNASFRRIEGPQSCQALSLRPASFIAPTLGHSHISTSNMPRRWFYKLPYWSTVSYLEWTITTFVMFISMSPVLSAMQVVISVPSDGLGFSTLNELGFANPTAQLLCLLSYNVTILRSDLDVAARNFIQCFDMASVMGIQAWRKGGIFSWTQA